MVAEFRLDSPNMSYVNVTSTSGTGRDSTNSSMNEISNSRRAGSIRGHILRGGDSALLTGIMDAVPELKPIVMGGSGVQHDQLERMHQQAQYYPSDANSNNRSATSNVNQSPVPNGMNYVNSIEGSSNYQSSINGSGFNNNIGASEGNFSRNPSNLLPNGNPRIRVANLPRSSSAFSNNLPEQNPNVLPRSFSAANQYLQVQYAPVQEHQIPSVTVIRTTSTLEYTGSPEMASHLAQNIASDHGATNVYPSQNQRRIARARPMHNRDGLGATGNISDGEDSLAYRGPQRRPSRGLKFSDSSESHRYNPTMRRSPSTEFPPNINGSGDMDQGQLNNHESLIKENEDLKRKLHILVNTINDEQKLTKVLKCLKEKKLAAQT